MDVKIIKDVKVALVLTEKEATWLKNISQNPIGYDRLEDEPTEDRNIRMAFFTALNRI
jgi:hypothetical protein